MERLIVVLLVVAGLVNLVPVAGLVSADVLASAYGIDEPSGDLLVLMRHRALLFGLLGSFIVASALWRNLRPTAVAGGLVSMLGFVALALSAGDYGEKLQTIVAVDVAASAGLIIVAVLLLRAKRNGP